MNVLLGLDTLALARARARVDGSGNGRGSGSGSGSDWDSSGGRMYCTCAIHGVSYAWAHLDRKRYGPHGPEVGRRSITKYLPSYLPVHAYTHLSA